MDRQQVINSLDSLVAAIQPQGNAADLEVLRSDDTRALLQSASALLKADAQKRGRFVAAGTPWTAEEDARVVEQFDGGKTIAQIALQHGRTSSAITLRLVKLGKIDAASVKRRERSAQVA